uniref:TSGP4 n=1 Tax=Ornithodoros kalahariensis TaxID=1580572 RepID=Q8I9T9_ORNKA|nr:TSGP4 [Ornithodoros kalahariensis]
MDCKLVAIALFIFSLDFAHAANDVWNVLKGSDSKFLMVKRTYERGANKCVYMKRTSMDESSHTLEVLMGYSKAGTTTDFVEPSKYTVTATSEGASTYNMMTVRRGPASHGVKFELVYSDDQGCNILQMKTSPFPGKCELWAPEGKAKNVESSCSGKFKELCGDAVETPYAEGCRVP